MDTCYSKRPRHHHFERVYSKTHQGNPVSERLQIVSSVYMFFVCQHFFVIEALGRIRKTMEQSNGFSGMKNLFKTPSKKGYSEKKTEIQFQTLPFSTIEDGLDRTIAENVFKVMVAIFYPRIHPISSDFKEYDNHYEIWTDYPNDVSINVDALVDIHEVNAVHVMKVWIDSMKDRIRIRVELRKTTSPINFTVQTVEFRQRIIASPRRGRTRRIETVSYDSLENDVGHDIRKKIHEG